MCCCDFATGSEKTLELRITTKPNLINSFKKTLPITSLNDSYSNFDDFEDLNCISDNVLEWQIVKMRFFYGFHPSKTINGFQVTYRNHRTWQELTVAKRCGLSTFIRNQNDICFEKNELITTLQAKVSGAVDQLTFYTNKHRGFRKGGLGEGRDSPYVGDSHTVVGFYGATGQSLQQIGFYIAPIKEIRYQRKRPYLILRAQLLKKKSIQKRFCGQNHEAEMAFGLLANQGSMIFAQVMKFI